MSRTNLEIVQQTKELASRFYGMMGYMQGADYDWQGSQHPQERLCWEMACEAQDLLTETDVEDCLNDLEDEEA